MISKRYERVWWICFMLLMLGLGGYGMYWLYQQEKQSELQPITPPSEQQIKEQLSSLPLRFEKNKGQVDEKVRFLVKNGSMTIFFTPSEVVYSMVETQSSDKEGESPTSAKRFVLRQTFIGSSPEPEIFGEQILDSKVNYFIGNDPSKWVQGGETYGSVRYIELYPGIDVVYSGISSRLEYAYEIGPDTDLESIIVRIAGASGMHVDSQGVLVLQTEIGSIAVPRPTGFQTIDGRQQEVPVFYRLIAEDGYGFVVAAYDTKRALRIQSQAD